METVQPVAVQLDKERHLKLTMGGMKLFQENTGKSLLKGLDMEDMSESELVTFIWACLVWEDRDLTIEEVGFMLDINVIKTVAEKLAEALNISAEKEESANPQSLPHG